MSPLRDAVRIRGRHPGPQPHLSPTFQDFAKEIHILSTAGTLEVLNTDHVSAPHTGGWTKAPPELVERFLAATEDLPGTTRRPMFGFPAVFANGYMFSGLHQDRWVVRLTDADLAELAAQGGRPFEPMPGRPMSGYLALPADIASDPAAARPWVERALANVLAMSPKPGR